MMRRFAILPMFVLSVAASDVWAQPAQDIFECKQTHSLERGSLRPAPADCARTSGVLGAQATGAEAAPDERHTAAIFFKNASGNPDICSGVLLDTRHVLTAGHCGCGMTGTYTVTFEQFAGRPEQASGDFRIDRGPILFDPMACVLGISPGYDLALLRLDRDAPNLSKRNFGFPAFALTADFREQLKPSMSIKVVGYGETEAGVLGNRMKTTVPVLSPDCLDPRFKLFCAPFQEMVLADRPGSRVPRDTCGGDSGGPAFVRAKIKLPVCRDGPDELFPGEEGEITATQDVVVAITSRATPFTHQLAGGHCGGGGTYTLIGRRSVHAWLEANHVNPQVCAFHSPE